MARCVQILLVACALASGPGALTLFAQHPLPASPSSLAEALDSLEHELSPAQLEYIRDSAGEDMADLHMSVGLGIRNTWGLWAHSRLALYFDSIGVYHPDDMSGIILTSLWRRLHGLPINLDQQVSDAQTYWRYARPPDSTTFASCPKGVHLFGGTVNLDKRPYIMTHIGQCVGTKQWWTYNADRGWQPADSSQFRDLLDLPDVAH